MRRPVAVVLVFLMLVAAPVLPTHAGTDMGHQLAAQVGWAQLSTQARHAVALLRQASKEAGIASMFREEAGPPEVRQRDFFARAATSPDIVRAPRPTDRHKLHHAVWHFRDLFFKQDAHSSPVDGRDIDVPSENAIGRLETREALLADTTKPPAARAVARAWVLQLVGDIHQPLHGRARVTSREPRGDRGGNDFALDPKSLHSYWDWAIDRAVVRAANEATSAHLTRVPGVALKAHPQASLAGELKPGKFGYWCQESFDITKEEIYPDSLRRGQAPPPCLPQERHRHHQGAGGSGRLPPGRAA